MKKDLTVAVYQLESKVGDIEGNSRHIIEVARQAKEKGVNVLIFPELALTGYFPFDLMNYSAYKEQERWVFKKLTTQLPHNMAVIIGTTSDTLYYTAQPSFYNSATIIADGKIVFRQHKRLLANNDVFFEKRYFQSGRTNSLFVWENTTIGLTICEDIWHEEELGEQSPARQLIDQGANIIITLNASPYAQHKQEERLAIAKLFARHNVAFVYANSCGAVDDLVFEGSSILMNNQGQLKEGGIVPNQYLSFQPFLTNSFNVTPLPKDNSEEMKLLQIISLALKSYVKSSRFSKVHLGLSGGIDSALVSTLAVKALGADAVTGILMPSRFSSEGSVTDSLTLAQNLGIKTLTIPLEQSHSQLAQTLAPFFKVEGLTDENLQARLRGLYLMTYSNAENSLLLTTGNKSEMAVGYCTLYGDMCGAFNPIGDLYKTQVYILSNFINKQASKELIPKTIIDKKPSAELREDQFDQQSLPPYEILDPLLYDFLELYHDRATLIKKYEADLVDYVLPMVVKNEYKRKQAPLAVKLSRVGFGRGRIVPLSREYLEIRDCQ